MEKIILSGLSEKEIFNILKPLGFTADHAHETTVNIYKRHKTSFDDFARIPEKLRTILKTVFQTGIFSYADSVISADKSVKYLFRTSDGRQFETVYIPEGKRHTVCVSTQSGCRMGCSFCVSGSYGFHGNLSVSEILNQVLAIDQTMLITHIVFMGMGEPLDNIDNVMKAADVLTSQWGLALSPRHVTVSTVGIKKSLARILIESDLNLTLSLHSPFPAERSNFIPAETRNPFSEILEMMKNASLKKGRRLSVAYVMIDGINDSDRHLNELKALLAKTSVRINLLPFHPSDKEQFKPSSVEKLQYFKHNLIIAGISASVRKSRGEDVAAACGLLAANLDEKNRQD
jgi:23S rRNA (adenine2503-C2)-methyltransferase